MRGHERVEVDAAGDDQRDGGRPGIRVTEGSGQLDFSGLDEREREWNDIVVTAYKDDAPPGLTASSALIVASATPAQSMRTSTWLTSLRNSVVRTSTVAVAPMLPAALRRWGLISATVTSVAPSAGALRPLPGRAG